MRRLVASVALVVAVLGTLASGASAAPATGAPQPALRPSAPPVLAYYYLWYEAASWRRAKTDEPVLGPYSSDDASVMTRQVQWAKRAGIAGFLVSWKHTPTLDRRLSQLVDIADREQFALGIVYQGLDFHRQPQPATRVAGDLDYFVRTFAARRPFTHFGRPVVVWSGTWKFTPEDIAGVTAPYRADLQLLASEKNVEGYRRIAGSVDGDAYYWSSVNPSSFRGYVEKLSDLGREVHAHQGWWVAPAAPGFDARGVGGTSTVPRQGDRTLLGEIDAALASSPNALGIISWNEFSENSQIEPSVRYGWTALNAVGVRLGRGPVGSVRDHGTGRPVPTGGVTRARVPRAAGTGSGNAGHWPAGLWVITGFVILFVVLVVTTARRAHRAPPLHSVPLEARGVGSRGGRRNGRSPGPAVATGGRPRAGPGRESPGTRQPAHRRRHKTPLYRLVLDELSTGPRDRRRRSS